MIHIHQLNQHYGGTQILWNLNLDIPQGEVTCIMGRNGVGKTTLLKCLMGILPVSSGSIVFEKSDFERSDFENNVGGGINVGGHIEGLQSKNKPIQPGVLSKKIALESTRAEQRACLGIGYVPQGRHIFPLLTVEENLRIGLPARRDKAKIIPQKIFTLFPVLQDMKQRLGGDLSGGQQQQLAIARALVIEPSVLILDEPNEGIQPSIVRQIGDVILKLNREENLTVILVEQKLGFARRVGQVFRLMEKGRIVASDHMENLTDSLIKQHLAV